jgi:hypothetical protein
MESTTKLGFTVIQTVEIPAKYLHEEVVSAMIGLAVYIDSEAVNEFVCPGNVFDTILAEQEKYENRFRFKLSDGALQQVIKLVKDCKNYELIRVNRI